ncbi:polysaccharide pyruvyl transferase family protein [Pseudomonas putida]|uniref:polysaccharide pyruvyl transferase family protein n=1 Tax=Pseudomonas putida TaxID=303 RepID=UPI001576E30B|nr:polysaccharide pyruvyl transferase family protein [Pseudomonas putida]NTY99427.1 polysaccharide pyruvyl transferase family protein [Pseudomonas putida]NTZ24189.1 polysaccharide pyruvyl transferase family protein [Pseudomonas putida]NTZ54694.1 polysaccharide pyruvyl transferase family protein [Pseudomonas putida]NTZ66305.1 polysaccharide pyruvyl transferase family protein [Pseudomonas putida]
MRYGKITQHYPEHHVQPLMNVGDIVQTLAVEYLYDLLGVDSEQVIGVSKYELREYQGEKVVLPVTGFFNERPDMGEVPFSEKIIPVFLGYHLGWGLYNSDNLEFFKKHQPIGCRDTYTQQVFSRHGVASYVCGCPTVIFPRRVEHVGRNKVFLVDTPAELDAFVPAEMWGDIEKVSHIVPIKQTPLQKSEYLELVEYTKSLLARYRDEARLVVTGRIHCALPCLAMGIPVIFTTYNMQEAYDFLLSMIKVHTPDLFHEINWNPRPVDLESVKSDFIDLAKSSICAAYASSEYAGRLDGFYRAGSGAIYYQKERSKLEALFAGGNKEYIIWGVGALGSKVFQLMEVYYPEVRLRICCDTFAKCDFFGSEVIRPDQLPSPDEGVIVLAATSYGLVESESFLEGAGYMKGVNYDNFFVHPGIRK